MHRCVRASRAEPSDATRQRRFVTREAPVCGSRMCPWPKCVDLPPWPAARWCPDFYLERAKPPLREVGPPSFSSRGCVFSGRLEKRNLYIMLYLRRLFYIETDIFLFIDTLRSRGHFSSRVAQTTPLIFLCIFFFAHKYYLHKLFSPRLITVERRNCV